MSRHRTTDNVKEHHTMLDAVTVGRVQDALERMRRDENGAGPESVPEGWLVFDFHGRNPIMTALAGAEVVTGRRAFVYIPREGKPTAIIHCVDQESWRTWPEEWTRHVWVARENLTESLQRLVGGKTIAMEVSPLGAIPYIDCVPTGMMDLIRSLGARVVSSASLVTNALSAWTPGDLASHQRAARRVAAIAGEAFQRVRDANAASTPVGEWEIAQFIVGAFDRAGLRTEHGGTSVSYGPNAARIHHRPTAEESAFIRPGALLLIDLWAAEPDGVFADQTWMAAVGTPSEHDTRVWTAVRDARDSVITLLRERVGVGAPISGAELDRTAWARLTAHGFGMEHRVARTGHSMDRFGVHGLGPSVDDTETHDDRPLTAGVGFSVEPGLYLTGVTGARSEVNVYIGERDILVTPDHYQRELIPV